MRLQIDLVAAVSRVARLPLPADVKLNIELFLVHDVPQQVFQRTVVFVNAVVVALDRKGWRLI